MEKWYKNLTSDIWRLTIEPFKPGIFQEITKRCYEPLFQYFPEKKAEFHQQWEESNKDTFDNPAIGRCVFVTCINDKPIGFASWDPRQNPIGILGQKCILPEYQGKGFGKKQILEVIKILKNSGFERLRVTTSDHEFFVPAHKMYKSCGFKEIKRTSEELFDWIQYEKILQIASIQHSQQYQLLVPRTSFLFSAICFSDHACLLSS